MAGDPPIPLPSGRGPRPAQDPARGGGILDVSAREVLAFVHRADALVPPGTEHRHIDLDRVVEQLTAGNE
ncbi:hypothetical protein ACFTXM_14855 [Streptomyces sp. NPDC056930]|uniref:hypothetical protein n=1 Tax=Streptomyces sp. NPDC056930 TaxID=3345967 RepID=UPI00363A4796